MPLLSVVEECYYEHGTGLCNEGSEAVDVKK